MSQAFSNAKRTQKTKHEFVIEPAPMAGYTDYAFRKTLLKCGASVTWTEMISAAALSHGSKKTLNMLKSDGKTIVQLFGKNPAHFETAIKSGVLDEFTEININMGCPARKVTSNGDGCALMKNPELAREIIETCVRVSKRPVSVKMRLGFSPDIDMPYSSLKEFPQSHPDKKPCSVSRQNDVLPYVVQFALMCQTAGASRIIVHGRYGTQGYSGAADWKAIAETARAVKIPVIANGDIENASLASECIEQTGAAGAMIGRALIGAPWRISNKKIDVKKIIKYHLKHADNIIEMRKHLVAYANHLPNGKELKKRLAVCKSFKEALELID